MTLRRLSLVPWGVVALALHGCCLTETLWSSDGGEQRVLVDETAARHLVAVSLGADSALQLAPVPAPDAEPRAWRLTGEGEAPVALTFLTAGGPLLIEELIVDASIEWEGGEPVRSDAEVRIVGRLDASRLGQPIAWHDLPPATRELLQQGSGPRFAFGADEPLAVPGVFHRCGERLRELDLTPLVQPAAADRPVPVCAASVLVGADLQPFHADPAASENGVEPSLGDQLRLLEPARFVVLMTDGSRESLFVVRADRVPLWSSLARTADGRHEHRSRWSFRAEVAAEHAPRWRGTLRVAERRFEWRSTGLNVWERLALTPLAVAGDVCGAWLLSLVGLDWWCDDEEDEEDEPPCTP